MIFSVECTAWNFGVCVLGDKIKKSWNGVYSPTAGIIPAECAAHHRALIPKYVAIFNKYRSKIKKIAYAGGPGIPACLQVCKSFLNSLDWQGTWVRVHHGRGHLAIANAGIPKELSLVAYLSGANAGLYLHFNGKLRLISTTFDLTFGNLLDMFGRHIGLSHPGGPKLENLHKKCKSAPEINMSFMGLDFALSGALNAAKKNYDSGRTKSCICGIQCRIFNQYAAHCHKIAKLFNCHGITLIGGVANSKILQKSMIRHFGIRQVNYSLEYNSDNPYMIGLAAILYGGKDEIKFNPDWALE